MKATVIGDGAWGTALALTLDACGHEVRLWGAFPDNLDRIVESGENAQFLPGVTIPATIRVTADLQQAVHEAELLVLAVPSQFQRAVLQELMTTKLNPDTVYLNVAKGLELTTGLRMHQVVKEVLGDDIRYAVLSGPSHAEEVARNVPTAVVTASPDQDVREMVQAWLTNDVFRVYTSDDVPGVELGGALKNVLALGVGFCDGMNLGDNPKAALMTRGIAEMARLGRAVGGRAETFAGLSGIGDLIVTCMSAHSRNRHVGQELGRGRTLEEIQHEMGETVAEGVKTAVSARNLARQKGVETPIVNAVYEKLYEGKTCAQVVRDLMSRQPKPEHYGEERWMP